MSLADEIQADAAPYKNKRAWVEERLEALGELDEFTDLMANPKIAPTAIWKALGRRDIRVAEATIHKWARRDRGQEQ